MTVRAKDITEGIIPPSAPAPQAVSSPVSEEADSNDDAMSWTQLTKDITTDAPDRNIIDADNPIDAPIETQQTVVPEEPKVVEAAPAIAEPPKTPEIVPAPTVVEVKKDEPIVASVPPEVKATEFNQLQANFIEEALKQYKLTDEQATQLMTDPNEVLPRLAATLEANITQRLVQTMAQMVQQFVPQYTEHYTTQRAQTSQAEDAFFGKWSELKEHKDRVMDVGRIYRQMKPQATADEFIRDVGMQVWMGVGLPVEKLAAKLINTPAPQPQAAPVQRPIEGYAPANPGGRGPGAPASPSNPFELLAQEILQNQ